MLITYLCNEYPPAPHGGIGTFVHTMACAMARAGHDVTVAGMGGTPGEIRSEGVRVVTLPRSRLVRGRGLADRIRLYRWLRADVERRGTQVVETPEFEGYLPLPLGRCAVAVRLHQSATAMAKLDRRHVPTSIHRYEGRLLREHGNWIGVSRFAVQITRDTFRLAPVHQRVIYSPVTLPSTEPTVLPPSADYLLYAGTVVPRKGVCVLAEAARHILAEFPSIHLVFAGPIPCGQPDLSARLRGIAGPQAAARLHFTGSLDRASLAAHMRRARAFLFPSTLETFGLVTAEAMLAGAPVVAANCGPNPEFIRDGENGLLVPPNDAPGLAAAASRLLRNPELAATLAGNGRRTVERDFSVDRCVRLSEEFYAEICARARGDVHARNH